ncbi:MAG: hypothetical protein ABSE64_10115 [Vulcanimicrobiaceae bacterium]
MAPLIAVSLLASDGSAAAEPDANALLRSLRSNLARQAYPSLMSYAITVHVQSNGVVREDHYDGHAKGGTGDFRVSQFSHEEEASPYVPHGINVVLMLQSGSPVMLSKQLPAEPLGVPNLSPIYSFGLRRCPDPSHASDLTTDSGLRRIGVVVSTSRIYNASFVNDEMIDGVETSHLALLPVLKPDKNRIRDVWVDGSNNLVQARVSGNFTARETLGVSWLLRFQTINGSTFIQSETAEGPISVDHRRYDSVSIEFSDISIDTALTTLEFALPKDSSDGGLQEPAADGPC